MYVCMYVCIYVCVYVCMFVGHWRRFHVSGSVRNLRFIVYPHPPAHNVSLRRQVPDMTRSHLSLISFCLLALAPFPSNPYDSTCGFIGIS